MHKDTRDTLKHLASVCLSVSLSLSLKAPEGETGNHDSAKQANTNTNLLTFIIASLPQKMMDIGLG